MKLINKYIDMPNLDKIPEPVQELLDSAATAWAKLNASCTYVRDFSITLIREFN